MNLGKISFIFILFSVIYITSLQTEEKITTVPLINLENLEASFEIEDLEEQNTSGNRNLILKEKKK